MKCREGGNEIDGECCPQTDTSVKKPLHFFANFSLSFSLTLCLALGAELRYPPLRRSHSVVRSAHYSIILFYILFYSILRSAVWSISNSKRNLAKLPREIKERNGDEPGGGGEAGGGAEAGGGVRGGAVLATAGLEQAPRQEEEEAPRRGQAQAGPPASSPQALCQALAALSAPLPSSPPGTFHSLLMLMLMLMLPPLSLLFPLHSPAAAANCI